MTQLGIPVDRVSIPYAYPIHTHSMYRDRDRDLYRDRDGNGDKTEKNTKTEKKTFYANLQKSAASSLLCHFALERVKSSPSRFHNRRGAA